MYHAFGSSISTKISTDYASKATERCRACASTHASWVHDASRLSHQSAASPPTSTDIRQATSAPPLAPMPAPALPISQLTMAGTNPVGPIAPYQSVRLPSLAQAPPATCICCCRPAEAASFTTATSTPSILDPLESGIQWDQMATQRHLLFR